MNRLIIFFFILLSISKVHGQNDYYAKRSYINPFVQGLLPVRIQPLTYQYYDVNFLQNFMVGINYNFELTGKIVFHSSVKLNYKKMEILYKSDQLQGDNYYNGISLTDRNIKSNMLDFSIGIGYKYQYGRNVVIPYFDIRVPVFMKEQVEDFTMKEIGTNNYRVFDINIDKSWPSFSYEAGIDYQVHFSARRGFFGSIGYIYSPFRYQLETRIDNYLYNDQVITDHIRLFESGFFASAGFIFAFGRSSYVFPVEKEF